MIALPLALAALLVLSADQGVERQHVLEITGPDIDGGILSEITWDNGALLLQGVVANPDGSLSGRYVVIPARGTTLEKRKEQTDSSVAYWARKSKRTSPTGLGAIATGSDSKMPMYGIASLEHRMGDAVDMGGMQQKTIVRLGKLVLHERENGVAPYDGEVWSWSPAELNRIAYVDGKGRPLDRRRRRTRARRLLKGTSPCPRGPTTAGPSRSRKRRTADAAGTSAWCCCPKPSDRRDDAFRNLMTDEAPKSALEIAMERLKKKDADSGFVEQKLTDAQKGAIAEARSVHEARVAELQILHRGKQLTAVDPAEIEKIEQSTPRPRAAGIRSR